MRTSESIKSISVALLKAQRKMGSATKDAKNPFFKSNYADLGAVMEVVKDPLNEEGIFILQPTSTSNGMHFVETILMHESGEYIASEPLKLELSKTDMQALGSAITYARRYSLQSLLSIPAEDDDGEKSMARPAKTAPASKPTLVETPIHQAVTQSKAAASADFPVPAPKSGFGGFKASKPKTDLGF